MSSAAPCPTRVQWRKVAESGTCPALKNHAAVAHGTDIIVFGGFNSRSNNNVVNVFDTVTLTWRGPLPCSGAVPPARNGHAMVIVDSNLFVIGGWCGVGPRAAADVYMLNLVTREWKQPPIRGSICPCNMHSANYVPEVGKIIVVRGGDGELYLSDVHTLDPVTMVWSRVTTEGRSPPPRANHGATTVGSQVFVFGGWNGSERLNDLWAFNPITSHWAEIRAPKPASLTCRAGMALATVDDMVVVYGGSGPRAHNYGDLHLFDIASRTWHATAKSENNPDDAHSDAIVRYSGTPPGAISGHTAVAVGQSVFIMGGSSSASYLTAIYSLDVDPPPEVAVKSPGPLEALQQHLADFVGSEEFADVVFVVEGRRIPSHRILLTPVSERFRALLTSGFRESSADEVEVVDVSYKTFRQVLQFLYTVRRMPSGSVVLIQRCRALVTRCTCLCTTTRSQRCWS
mmetsp:Transcript_22258/g.71653  ORF Transcript_22258/g.71653 Transcript_22258/m.71653 type:complete len:457 (+) Transcript_22258:2-1372(+)